MAEQDYGKRILGEKRFEELEKQNAAGGDRYGSRVTDGAERYGKRVAQETAEKEVEELSIKALGAFLEEHPERVSDAIASELAKEEPRKGALELLAGLTEDDGEKAALAAALGEEE